MGEFVSIQTTAFIDVNLDACQYQAKLQLLDENVLEYASDLKNTNFKFK